LPGKRKDTTRFLHALRSDDLITYPDVKYADTTERHANPHDPKRPPVPAPPPLLEQVIDSHGGMDRWRSFDTLHADLTFGGLAFTARFNWAGLRPRRVHISTHRPMAVFEDYPGPDRRGLFTPDHVWIETSDGELLVERTAPRSAFRSWRRSIWWDDLDLLYFAGYAVWNYLTTPFLLAFDGVATTEIAPWQENGEVWRRLIVHFPDTIPTHSSDQVFYFDDHFRLRRFDYNPTVFASWAKANTIQISRGG